MNVDLLGVLSPTQRPPAVPAGHNGRPRGFEARLQAAKERQVETRAALQAEIPAPLAHRLAAHERAQSAVLRVALGRIRQLEALLLEMLASDVEPDLRAATIRALHDASPARRNRARDAKLLSDVETTMIERYRAMDDAGRAMLRTLVERLHATAGRDTGH